jgi:hypothetical protein
LPSLAKRLIWCEFNNFGEDDLDRSSGKNLVMFRLLRLLFGSFLSGQILVPQQQFLVHRSGDLGQHARPEPAISIQHQAPVSGFTSFRFLQ